MNRHGHEAQDHDDDHLDGGLEHDLPRILSRRSALGSMGLGLAGLFGLGTLASCGSDAGSTTSAGTTASSRPAPPSGGLGGGPGAPDGGSTVAVADGEIPEETAGPYPGDGSNGINVLDRSGIVRSDLTTSFGSAGGTAEGVPMTLDLRLLDLDGDTVAPLAGAALYVWHCTADGQYSLYSEAIADEDYLRGVQVSDAQGRVRFTSIVPGCYSGRWPHVHFEVYASRTDATGGGSKLRTSQLAFPQDMCKTVYADPRYAGSADNLAQVSLSSDMVFADGHKLQLATVSGSNDAGWTVKLAVPV